MIVGIVGCGNMGEAIAAGLLPSKGTVLTYKGQMSHEKAREPEPDQTLDSVIASHPRAARAKELAAKYGMKVSSSNVEVARRADLVILAVKPGKLAEVMPEIAEAVRGKLVVSVAAGMPFAKLAAGLPGARLFRVMPNQAVRVRAGVTCMMNAPDGEANDGILAASLFLELGETVWLRNEQEFHAVTALAGSGPAFFYRVAEGMIDGAIALGLQRHTARFLTAHTMAGAGRILVDSTEWPADLVKRVASPGGTTLAGLAAMEKAKVQAGMTDAVRAATERSREMAGERPRAKKKRAKK